MKNETHTEFIERLFGAPQDISLPIFQKLLRQRYDQTTWRTNAGATDAPCISKDGDQLPLKDFLAGLRYKAPIYEKPQEEAGHGDGLRHHPVADRRE